MTELRYDIVDVFTDQPYTGNPLAVVHGGAGLSGAQMQAIAREFNLSETTFVLPATDPQAADYRIRIFTPGAELPFAGHPSIGTAWSLAHHNIITAGDRVQECGAGLLSVFVDDHGARVSGGVPAVGAHARADDLAIALGLTAADIDNRAAPGWASAGHPYLFALVRPEALGRIAVDNHAITALTEGPHGLVACAIDSDATQVRARMFAPGSGTPEDPATGSAAVALGVYLADRQLIPRGGIHRFSVVQGVEMGRPSLLHATVQCQAGTVVATSVSGAVVAVGNGVLHAPPLAR